MSARAPSRQGRHTRGWLGEGARLVLWSTEYTCDEASQCAWVLTTSPEFTPASFSVRLAPWHVSGCITSTRLLQALHGGRRHGPPCA